MSAFNLDPTMVTSVIHSTTLNKYEGIPEGKLTFAQKAEILTGRHKTVVKTVKNHPEYDNFRTTLDADGFIIMDITCFNNDKVLKHFSVNGFDFYRGDIFPAAETLNGYINNSKDWNYDSIY
jgi:hypothetical protein